MKLHALATTGLALSISAGAAADLVINLDTFTASGFDFFLQYSAGDLTGTLSAISVDAVLVQAGVDFTWASDLAVVVSTDTLDPPYFLQVGGFSQITGVEEYTDGLSGFSGAAGTIVSYSYDLIAPLEMSDKALWLGNGYAFGGDGVWSGTVTLHGVSQIPAPGAFALLGLAGLVARRRRG